MAARVDERELARVDEAAILNRRLGVNEAVRNRADEGAGRKAGPAHRASLVRDDGAVVVDRRAAYRRACAGVCARSRDMLSGPEQAGSRRLRRHRLLHTAARTIEKQAVAGPGVERVAAGVPGQ